MSPDQSYLEFLSTGCHGSRKKGGLSISHASKPAQPIYLLDDLYTKHVGLAAPLDQPIYSSKTGPSIGVKNERIELKTKKKEDLLTIPLPIGTIAKEKKKKNINWIHPRPSPPFK